MRILHSEHLRDPDKPTLATCADVDRNPFFVTPAMACIEEKGLPIISIPTDRSSKINTY